MQPAEKGGVSNHAEYGPEKNAPCPAQDPNVRNKNFKEVALGYTDEMAVNEAKRCLQLQKARLRAPAARFMIDIPALYCRSGEGRF